MTSLNTKQQIEFLNNLLIFIKSYSIDYSLQKEYYKLNQKTYNILTKIQKEEYIINFLQDTKKVNKFIKHTNNKIKILYDKLQIENSISDIILSIENQNMPNLNNYLSPLYLDDLTYDLLEVLE